MSLQSTLKVMSSLGSTKKEVLPSCDGQDNQWEDTCNVCNDANVHNRFGSNGATMGPHGEAAVECAWAVQPRPEFKIPPAKSQSHRTAMMPRRRASALTHSKSRVRFHKYTNLHMTGKSQHRIPHVVFIIFIGVR